MYQQLTIVGRLGREPELRYTPTGTAVCTFNVATDKVWLKDDVKQEETTWHRVTTWKAQAENCAKYLAKGSMVLVTGTVKANAYMPKNGGDPAASLEVNAEVVKFLTRAEADAHSSGNGTPVAAGQSKEEDIPW